MKKKILLVVLVGMLFAGVVSAASIWGTYKGNQIIRITSNGVPLQTPDVPAISYNGRTMVPINLLGQLGVSYTWNSKNQTVEVKVDNKKGNVEEIKANIYYADYFHNLETLGDMIVGLSTSYSTAMDFAMIKSDQTSRVIKEVNDSLNTLISDYNHLNNLSVNYNNEPNVAIILNNYHDAFEYYKKTADSLSLYYITKSSNDFSGYSSNRNLAFSKANSALGISSKRYTYYIQSALASN